MSVHPLGPLSPPHPQALCSTWLCVRDGRAGWTTQAQGLLYQTVCPFCEQTRAPTILVNLLWEPAATSSDKNTGFTNQLLTEHTAARLLLPSLSISPSLSYWAPVIIKSGSLRCSRRIKVNSITCITDFYFHSLLTAHRLN